MPVSEEQLSALPPMEADKVRIEAQQWGDDAAEAIYENIVRRLSATGTVAPPDPKDLSLNQRRTISEAEMGRAFARGAQSVELEELDEASPAEARQRGEAAAREVLEAPRTARGARVAGVKPGVLETAPLPEALRAAFKPQPLVSPEDLPAAKEAKVLRDQETRREQDALKAIAFQQAKAAHQTGQNMEALYRQYYEQAARDAMVVKRQESRARARGIYFGQPGVEPADSRSPAKQREQFDEIEDLANEFYLDWRDRVFEDVDIPGEERQGRSLSSYTKQLWRRATVNESAEGVPYETWLAAGMRGLGGLIRPLTKTGFEALSFEVDEDGNPIDTDDINYKLYEAQEKALEDIQSGEGSLADYAVAASGFLPTAMGATRTHGPRGEANTGSWSRDMIISVAQGNFLGDDVANLQAAKNFYQGTGYEWVPWAAGMMMEMPLPVTAVPVLKPAVKGALRAGASVADAVDVPQVAKAFRAMEEPVKAATQRILRQEVEAISEGLGIEARAARVLEDATLPSQVAEMMAGSVASAIRAGRASRIPTDTLAGKMVGELEAIYTQATNIVKTSDTLATGAKETERVARFGDTLLGKEIIQQVRMAEAIGVSAADIPQEVVKNLAKGRMKEHFANVLPNDWIRVAPYVVVTKKAVDEVGDAVNSKIKEITRITEVGDKVRFLRPRQVLAAMKREMPASTIGQNSRAFRIYQDLKAAKPLSREDYGWVHGIVQADVWKSTVQGAVRLRYTGAAAERSLVPGVRRLTLFRKAETLTRAVASATKAGFPPPAKVKTTGRVSIELEQWLNNTHEMLVELPAQFNKLLSRYVEQADSPEEAWDLLMNDLARKNIELVRATAKETGAAMPPVEDAADELASIVSNFFGDAFNIEGNSSTFARMLREQGIDTLNAENILKAIEHARLRQPDLKDKGLSTPWVSLIPGIPRHDEPMAAAFVWAMDKYRKLRIGEAEQALAKTYPELLIGFGRAVGEQAKVVESMVADGISEVLAEAISKHATSLQPANRKEVAEQVLGDLFEHGSVDSMASTARLYSAITNQDRVTKVILRSDKILSEVDKVLAARGLTKGDAGFEAARRAYAQQVAEAVFDSLTSMNVDRYVGMLGSMGISVVGKQPLDYGVFPSLVALSGNRGIFLSPEAKKIFEGIKESTFSGKLQQGLDSLKLADKPLGEAIEGYLFLAMNTARRSTISGFLGGVPLPAFRFIGQNNITAPMIVAITSPTYVWAAVKAIPEAWVGRLASVAAEADVPGARRASSYLNQRYFAKPSDEVLTTPSGRAYTKAEIDKLMEDHNVRFTQVTFEFGDMAVDEAYRIAKMGPDFMPVGARRSALRWIDPRKKNIWSRWTEEADMAFREAVFREALKRGEQPEIAAKLARNALLDYGAIPAQTRRWVGMLTLFYAFMFKNIEEVALAFVREPGAVRNLRRMVVMSHQQQKQSGTWLYGDDYQRNRLWSFYGEEWDRVWTGHFGPQVPAIQGFGTLINSMAIIFDSSYTGEMLTEYVTEDFIQQPALSYIFEKKKIQDRKEGPGPVFDARYVQFFKSMGMWEIAQSWFDIKTVKRGERRPGEPTFEEDGEHVQYRLSGKKGMLKWLAFTGAAELTGIERNIREYTSILISKGTIGEDAEMKRHADGSWWMYASNLSTPMKVTGELQALARMRYAIREELQALDQ